jgi:hypothetical protein
MNREVNLTKRVQTPPGWRYCTVVLSANGRVKPDVVLVNGKQETHKEGPGQRIEIANEQANKRQPQGRSI